MEVSEGVFLYVMTYLYNFDYLSDDVTQYQFTANQTLTTWYSNLDSYCNEIESTLLETYAKMEGEEFKHVKRWTKMRVS